MRMTGSVDPRFVIYTDGVNHERVSLILANRVPHPGARITVGMSSPIHVDSAHQVILIEQQEHLVRELTELEHAKLIQHEVGRTLRHTTGKGGVQVLASKVVWAPSHPGSLVFLRCPRLHLGLLRLLRHWRPCYSK